MGVNSVENSIILRKRIRTEWKGGRKTFRRNISIHIDLIPSKWASCYKSLFCTKKGLFCQDISTREHDIERIRQALHLIFCFGIRRNIESQVKVFLLSTSE